MADTASFSAAMKTKFIGPIRDHIPKGMPLLFGDKDAPYTEFKGILPKAEGIDFVGNEFRIPIKSERNNAVGFRSENEELPSPGRSQYTYLQEPMRYAYASFNITGQLLKASSSNEGAFKSAFKTEMEDTMLALKLDVNRAAHGDGTGKVTGVRSAATSGASSVDVDTTVNFYGGEIIDFVAANGNVISAAHKVTSVNRAGRAIGVSPSLGAALTTAHFIVRASENSTVAVPNNSQNKEIQGLDSIVADSGTLHGLNPAAYSFWKAFNKNVGGALTEDVLREAKDTVGFEQGLDVDNGLDFALITTRGIRSRFAKSIQSGARRLNDAGTMTVRGGYKVVTFDDNPIFTDDQTTPGTLYGLALNRLFWSQMSDWEWLEEDGKVLKWDRNRDRYLAVLFKYCQLGTTHRGAHFKLTGITDDVR